ncbi:MAG: hypothetical protein KTR21_08875, partial [Rhodobacteraceae bacterium]|nr:hypothetical protein [Paracoccaceae bacterium]
MGLSAVTGPWPGRRVGAGAVAGAGPPSMSGRGLGVGGGAVTGAPPAETLSPPLGRGVGVGAETGAAP